ncbi:MAG: Ppx/GppA family phosphatase [Firmicutes bacterium]|nr:Ppx/GppA family phosphatase [Bacillota bacterium]
MERIAIIDVGSNSVRLIIMDIGPEGEHHQIENVKETVRLVENTGPDGSLHPKAQDHAVETVALFARLCEVRGVDKILAVGTAAVRRAPNRGELLARLQRETGIEVKVLTGEEEADLDYIGVVNAVAPETGLIIDVGGGSTKLIGYRNRLKEEWAALPFGSVTLTRDFLARGRIEPASLAALEDFLTEKLARFPWLSQYDTVVALGGIARTLARIDRRRRDYRPDISHGYELLPESVEDILRWLARLDLQGRWRVAGMSRERADVIVAGIAVINQLLQVSGSSRVVTSRSGLRDGLLYQYLSRYKQDPILLSPLMNSVENLIKYYNIESTHYRHVNNLALSLYDQLRPLHGLNTYERRLLIVAALLHDIGIAVDHENRYVHTFYMMLNARLNGLTHRELVTSAFVAASHEHYFLQGVRSYTLPAGPLELEDLRRIMLLSLVLRLAKSLDLGKSGAVEGLRVEFDDHEVRIRLRTRGTARLEMQAAMSHAADFKAFFRRSLHIL